MMIAEFTAVLFGLFLFSTAVEAKIAESVQIELYDRNLKVSDTEMRKMLNKADLGRQGYTKEIDFKIVKEPDKPGYRQKSIFYSKIVNCSAVLKTERELNNTVFHGALGPELYNKLRDEMKAKGLINAGNCQTGIKIVLNYGKKKLNGSGRNRPRRIVEGGCIMIPTVLKPLPYNNGLQ